MKKLLLILILLTPLNVLGTDIPSVFDGRWNVIDFIGERFWEYPPPGSNAENELLYICKIINSK